jgi:hypothetical protein
LKSFKGRDYLEDLNVDEIYARIILIVYWRSGLDGEDRIHVAQGSVQREVS